MRTKHGKAITKTNFNSDVMNKEIKQQIEEEAAKTAIYSNAQFIDECVKGHLRLREIEAFIRGANFALSKWQESERWRKVEEEMPEHSGEPFLIRGHFDVDGNRCYWRKYFVAYQDKDFYKMTKSVMIDAPMYFVVTEWKPIVR